MQMIRTRPFSIARDFDALFQTGGRGTYISPGTRTWAPRVDVYESGSSLTVRYELAGFAVDDLEVTLEDGVLSVKGERTLEAPEGAEYRRSELARGAFNRSLRVGDGFDADEVKASYSQGLLLVTLEKRPEVLSRTIEVEAA